jgi:hypothetical protein
MPAIWLVRSCKLPKKKITEFPTSQPKLPEPILEQAIRQRAYELYVERGMVPGHALDDWLQAEAELVQAINY